MIIFKHISDISEHLHFLRQKGIKTGFVPTMGALHRGHFSLIENAGTACESVISSIFVNPTQFNDPADFDKYPTTLEQDVYQLEKAGCDVLFLPSVAEMYPNGLHAPRHYQLGYLETVLDGAFRPGHFQGVCQVVDKLLTIVNPDKLFLGKKDYQQCMVLTQLIKILQMPVEINICPTLREKDGLAMSSRNMRLTTTDRKKAPLIYEALVNIKSKITPGALQELKIEAVGNLTNNGFKVDYLEIADAGNLMLLDHWDGKTTIVILIAAFINEVRLIDNLLV